MKKARTSPILAGNAENNYLTNYLLSLSDFTNTPAAVKVASQAIPFLKKCALQLPLLLNFHWRTGTFPKIETKEFNTAAGGVALTDSIPFGDDTTAIDSVEKLMATTINAAVSNKTFFMTCDFIDFKYGIRILVTPENRYVTALINHLSTNFIQIVNQTLLIKHFINEKLAPSCLLRPSCLGGQKNTQTTKTQSHEGTKRES